MCAAKAYVFDAYGTLFDVHSAVGRFRDDVGEVADQLSSLWRDKQLQYTWVRTLAERHKPFHEVTADGLDFAIAAVGGVPAGVREKLLDAYMTLDAYPEVPEVLAALKGRGAKLAILSNGSPEMLEAAVTSSGIADLLDASLSIEDVGVFKPSPQVYQLAVDRLGVAAGDVSFQSSNRWDVAGAAAFGFDCVWINRFNQPDEFDDMTPRMTISSLSPLVEI
ncbi:MAG: haloacid dehalogenase type II [Hyphomicrobiaceae bacterium]